MSAVYGAVYGSESGATYAEPGDVREGIDRGDGTLGTLELPAVGDVREDVSYGADGTEFTGTLVVEVGGGDDEGDGTTLLADAKRRLETLLCALLVTSQPTLVFLPEQGGDGENAEDEVEPPYSVVALGEKEALLSGERVLDGSGETWRGEVTVTRVCHIGERNAVQHAQDLRAIRRALAAIRSGHYPGYGVTIHGCEVIGTPASVDDDERKSHGDVFRLSVGFTA